MITIETQEIIGDREFEQSFLVDRKNHIIKSTIKIFYEPFVEMSFLNLTHFRSGAVKISQDLLRNLENKNLIT